jgi:hypothetical protein
MFKNFFPQIVPIYQIMWKNMAEPDRPQMKMRIDLRLQNTHSEYVLLLPFSLQQWSHERASVLRYTYIACLVFTLRYLCLILSSSVLFL